MEQNILDAIQNISLGGGIAFAAWMMKPVWSGIHEWLKGRRATQEGTLGDRLNVLEKFQATAEGNHFTDLERLMEDVRDLQGESRETRKEVGNIRERLVRIETKMNGSLHT